MKYVGIILIIAGLAWGASAFKMDSTVLGSSTYFSDANRIHNLGLIEDRRDQLLLATIVFLSGMMLFCAGTVLEALAAASRTGAPKSQVSSTGGGQKKCPVCAESINIAAVKCIHWGHEFDNAEVESQIADNAKRLEAIKFQEEYKQMTEGTEDAFCFACRQTAPMKGMFYHPATGRYYHEGCLPTSSAKA